MSNQESDTLNEASVLVVDDTPDNLRLLSRMLTRRGYNVRPVPNGLLALESVRLEPPDLILLDIMMPQMDGYKVCKELKADEQTRDIPVIFISALNEVFDKVKAFQVGGVDYITKPFQFEEVAARVKTHLTIRDLQKGLEEKNAQLEQEVTERKRVEATLQERNAELDTFAHTVAHDLKNPVNAVRGFAELLLMTYGQMAEADLKKSIKRIVQAGYKIEGIINELMLLAGLRQQVVKPVPLDMAEIVEETMARLASLIEDYEGEFVMPDSWPIAKGYGPWIEEIWANYMSNALKYGGEPPRVELGATERDDGMISFWVRDNGTGISQEEQQRLFTPFTRLEQVRAKGHGLGLSIVRRIVEKLGGEAGVESEIGRGSVFSFTLPKA